MKDVLELQLFDDNQTYQIQTKNASSGAGKAVVGGLLFGGIGAIAGGLMGRKGPEYEQVSRIIRLGFSVVYENGKSESFNILDLLFNYVWISPTDKLFPKVKAAIAAICEALYPYTKSGKAEVQQAKLSETNTTTHEAKQLLEAAALLEKGLLTKKEFEMLKNKLLS